MLRSVCLLLITLSLISGVPAFAMKFTGTVYKSNQEETVKFDLALGDPTRAVYRLIGSTLTQKGHWQSQVDYSKIRTFKETRDAGQAHRTIYTNRGVVSVYYRERQLDPGSTLAGIPVEGSYLQGAFDDGLWLQELVVDGKSSRGSLDYHSFKQHYRAHRSCSFGATSIQGGKRGSEVVADYDRKGEFANQMRMSMRFGSLLIQGRIHYEDIEKVTITDVTHRSTEVIGTTGTVALEVKRLDGTEPVIAHSGPESQDERELRRLLAFIELFSFDMWSE